MTFRSNARITSLATYAAFSLFLFAGVTPYGFTASAENDYSVYVDNEGLMRRSDNGEETRFFGTNYTLPFAHAYRAMDYLGIDHKEAIDRDVYHLSRMGINAFRLHLWDVELSDSIGNLIENNHLDLLDYLISSLEERGISIILTAQTNFGNGYPERNTDTGAYSYDFGKCDLHANDEAIKAQQRYVGQLVGHRNRYTGRTYAADRSIIAIEINNEPCHQTSPKQVTGYIDSMVKAMRKGGWKKPILYNVSHNMDVVPGYYAAAIQGTTYQWYPIGLVAGHEQRGNFLPYVDSYDIPFSNVNGFGKKAKVVYEFDPADMLQSYMFPAVARTFAREGFQWATQFAYDPIDMARFNTEYQTHYLNLAYTPQKALGMKIAARVMEQTPSGTETAKYPADTIFGNATVSYRRNLALWNTPQEYFHTNNTDIAPIQPDSLQHIAGYGSSPVVGYQGKGAYFLDRIKPGIWRLEVFPDVLYSSDPFAKPSLRREVAHILPTGHPITISIDELGHRFHYSSVTPDNPFGGEATRSTFSVTPGVYLLSSDSTAIASIDPNAPIGNIKINEYVLPPVTDTPLHINHKAAPYAIADAPLTIRAEAFGNEMPDSLVIYPDDVSFWKEDNQLYTMHKVSPYLFEAIIPISELQGKRAFSYRIVAPSATETKTFPGNIMGTPLDWDASDSGTYTTRLLMPGDPITLLDASYGMDGAEGATIPDSWGRCSFMALHKAPQMNNAIKIGINSGGAPVKAILTKYTGHLISSVGTGMRPSAITVRTGSSEHVDSLTVSLVNRDGITYSHTTAYEPNAEIAIALSSFAVSPTLLCPAPYPVFLSREFIPENYTEPLNITDVEKLQLSISGRNNNHQAYAEIIGVWLK